MTAPWRAVDAGILIAGQGRIAHSVKGAGFMATIDRIAIRRGSLVSTRQGTGASTGRTRSQSRGWERNESVGQMSPLLGET